MAEKHGSTASASASEDAENPHRAPPTAEGWYMLHDARRVDWAAWKALGKDERARALEEARRVLASHLAVEDADDGASGLFALTGGKADLMLIHLRPTVDDLNLLERAFAQTRLADFTTRPYGYLSAVELGGYSGGENFGDDAEVSEATRKWMDARLHPDIPDMRYVSFYPMNKRREGEDNWYTVPFDERAAMMREHGMTGRQYAGKVKQIISGSMALDDWEWGVTVFSDDPAHLKHMVAEMRYDEVSARYGEFGPFYFGHRVDPDHLGAFMDGERV